MARRVLFRPGRVGATATAFLMLCAAAGPDGDPRNLLVDLVLSHISGDWGDVAPEQAARNARALEQGGRVISVHRLTPQVTIRVVTETGRRRTIVMENGSS